jgi:peptidyl-prolyl cis-trans isomerase C
MVTILVLGFLTMQALRSNSIAKFFLFSYLILISSTCLSAEKASKDSKATSDLAKTIKTVNGVAISQEQLNHFIENLKARGQQVGPDGEKMLLNELIARELVAGDARKKKLDALPEVKAQMMLMQQQILVETWFADYFKKNPIKEEDVRNEYNRQLEFTKSGRNSNEYSVSQILLGSEQEAQDISKRLEKNESFERIAQERSLDKPSAAQGGKLGWLLPSMIVKPLDDIVLSLKKGSVSNPIQTNAGWHILKVEDVRKFKPANFEEAKNNVMKGLVDAKRKALVEDLAKTAVIK